MTATQTYGEVFTQRWVVDLMLDLVGYTPDKPLHKQVVVEPSVGSGAFLVPIVERLADARPRNLDWWALGDAVRAFDVQSKNVEASRHTVSKVLVRHSCPADVADELVRRWVRHEDFLLPPSPLGGVSQPLSADFVIGNPPYIRIEDLPLSLLKAYRDVAPTMKGRADIFVAFFEHGLDILNPGGQLAYICADRWMRNSYGKALRGKIAQEAIAVDEVVVMHDAPAFDSAVSAYPAITVLRRGRPRGTNTALATANFNEEASRRYLNWRSSKRPSMADETVKASRLPRWHTGDDIWPDANPNTLTWLTQLAERFPLIESSSGKTRIGIGIATGADAVYLPEDPPNIEPSQLLPMVMAADIKSGTFDWTGRQLVSPWGNAGLIDLRSKPLLRAYYESHSDTLHRRNVAQRSAHWYRTIDRVNHSLLESELIVMQDMKSHAHPVRVPVGYYPHHNLTWVTSSEWDLDVLGGLLLSEVVERQVAAHCVKMRGGTLRFQPTVLRKVRLPPPSQIPDRIAAQLANAFRSRDRDAATFASLAAIGNLDLPSI